MLSCSRRLIFSPAAWDTTVQLGRKASMGTCGLRFRYWIRMGGDMRIFLAMALLLGLAAVLCPLRRYQLES
jgi:hypothetical protein